MTGSSGSFIVVEGIDGCGKSTQAELLANGLGALLTREPGGSPLGIEIRRLLLATKHGEVSDRAEALLMAADRAQHVVDVIRPTLLEGRSVVGDRYIGSSVAYQGYGRRLDVDKVRDISEWATDGLVADLVLLVDVPVATAVRRRSAAPDRIEAAGEAMQHRVREGFLAEAAANAHQWVVIDGDHPVADVAQSVNESVRERLGL